MQAIIIGSRSVTQDKFFKKQISDKYNKHLKQIQTIHKQRQNSLHDWELEVQSISHSLRKAKSSAKLFREKQDKEVLKKQNMGLLKRIWNLEPTVNSFSNDKFQFISGSNWTQTKRKLEEIKVQNKKLGLKVLQQQMEVKDYKKKLKQQIKEYIELRDHVRKFKIKESKPKRIKSEKIINKQVIDKPQNMKEQIKQKILQGQKYEQIKLEEDPQKNQIKLNE